MSSDGQSSKNNHSESSNDFDLLAWMTSTTLIFKLDDFFHVRLSVEVVRIKTLRSFIDNITPTSICPGNIELAITLFTKDENVVFQHSTNTPANGLCGYLAYFQLIQNVLSPGEYIASPDLADAEQLKRVKDFYEQIDSESFDGKNEKNDAKYRHNLFISRLNSLLNDTDSSNNFVNNYKRDTCLLAQNGWCSTTLMMKYDKEKLVEGAVRVFAEFGVSANQANQKYFFLQFHAKNLRQSIRLQKKSCNDLLKETKLMMVYNDNHFYLAPFPLQGFNLSAKFDEFWELLKMRLIFFKETRL